jgi:hypothetical protein
MGCFSYKCFSGCCNQSIDQFDWIEPCVVKVDTKNGKDVYVNGCYNSYGGVEIKTKDGETVTVYLREFEEHFDFWGKVKYTASEIYCNGVKISDSCSDSDDDDWCRTTWTRYCYDGKPPVSYVMIECLKIYGNSEAAPKPTEEEKKRYKYALKIKKIN